MLHLISKINNPATSIGVSNLKCVIKKSTITNFFNNVKDLLDDMFSNYYIIIDKV